MFAKRSIPYLRYLIRNPGWKLAFQFMDFVLSLFFPVKVAQVFPNPQKILLTNGAHLGDVLIATSVLPVLKSAFPEVKIGFLIGNWARPVLQNHPMIEWVHTVDHWKLNRSSISKFQKLKHYWRTRTIALREIRKVKYDVAVDLYYYFPNSIPLLWQANIPVRIGYSSAGFGPLLTHSLCWVNQDSHMSDYHNTLLKMMSINDIHLKKQIISLPPYEAYSVIDIENIIGYSSKKKEYIVFHIGSGSALREWPIVKWRALVEKFVGEDYLLIFTGNSDRENANIDSVITGLANCINLCGKLSWQDYINTISGARLLFGVESLAGHLAAAVKTPCVVIYSGISNTFNWRPLTGQCVVIKHTIPCAPCYRSKGCNTMDCVINVEVEQVVEAAKIFLD